MDPIKSMNPQPMPGQTAGKKHVEKPFGDFIRQAVKSVNASQLNADNAIRKNLEGKGGIHESMLAMQEADISMRFLLQVRNKVLDAYREIMRMPI